MSKILSRPLAAVLFTVLLGVPTSPARAAMEVGNNFWFIWREHAPVNPFVSNANFAAYPNHGDVWRPEFIAEMAPYKVLRFMDWGNTNNNTIVSWSNRRQPTDPIQEARGNGNTEFTWNGSQWVRNPNPPLNAQGIAFEYMIELCNRLDKDIWICVPHKADNNYVTQLARLLRDRVETGREIYVELSNEVWNDGFDQAQWALAEGAAAGFPGGRAEFYGYRAGQIFAIFSQEFAGQTSRITRVLAGHGLEYYATYWADHQVNGMNRVSGAGADAWAIAPYFGSGVNGAASDAISLLYADIDAQVPHVAAHDNWATQRGYKLLAYEGGQHVYTNADVVNRNPQMYDVYRYYLDQMNPYFDVFVAYAHAGDFSSGGAWGVKEAIGQAESQAHKYRGIKDWVNANGGNPPPPPPSNTANIASASSDPTIDGSIDSVWSSATSYSIANTTGTISSGSDCSGSFRALWNASYLFVLAEVTDDNKSNDSTDPWADDSVEVYVDGNNNKATSYDSNDRQYIFGWGDTTVREGGNRSSTNVTFAKADPTSSSYRVEVRVPWATLGVSKSAGQLIGLDVHINDDDAGGAREGKKQWNDTTDQAWQNPSLFGTGTLQAGGTPPPAPTGLSATAGNGQVALSWNASTGATSYNVKRSTTSGSGYSTIASPASTSYTNTGLTNGTTYYFVVSAVNSWGQSANSSQVSATPQASSGLPSGWTAQDIGGPTPAGSTSYSSGNWTVRGGGADIWGSSDQFHYASRDASGDVTIIARVDSVQNTYQWAKAGVMIRNGTAANAQFAMAVVTPSNGVRFQWRSATGADAADAGMTGIVAPRWVRLQRTGNNFTASHSSDGNSWTTIGTTQSISMPTSVKAGLCVSSVSQGTLNTSTFSNVSVATASPIARATTAVTIDGNIDLGYSGTPSRTINNVAGTISGASDLSASWQALWDATNLYVIVSVTDDAISNDSTNPWEDDAVELFVDGNNNKTTTYDSNDRQYIYGRGDTSIVEGAGRSTTGVTRAQASPSSTSYRIETKVPWSTLGVTASAGKLLGIDVHVDDDDNGGSRDGKRMWNDATDTAWTNPGVFGTSSLSP